MFINPLAGNPGIDSPEADPLPLQQLPDRFRRVFGKLEALAAAGGNLPRRRHHLHRDASLQQQLFGPDRLMDRVEGNQQVLRVMALLAAVCFV